MFPLPELLQSNSFSFHFSVFESFQEVIWCPQQMCQESHTSLFTPPASLMLTGSGRDPRAVLWPRPGISAGPHMRWSLGGKHRLCLAAWSDNFSPVCEKRGCRKPFPHWWHISVPSHRNAPRRDSPGISTQGELWLFRAAVEFFCIPQALQVGFFYMDPSLRASEHLPFLYGALHSWAPSLHRQGESREQRQIFLLRGFWCCKGSSGGAWESCQHSCTRKIKRQEPLPEHIYNTSNISKSIKAPLIHWTLTLPLRCCQIHQLGISRRKAAAWQELVTRRTKQEPLPPLGMWSLGKKNTKWPKKPKENRFNIQLYLKLERNNKDPDM